MKTGAPPTLRNALTGELTPPGISFCDEANNFSEFSCCIGKGLFYVTRPASAPVGPPRERFPRRRRRNCSPAAKRPGALVTPNRRSPTRPERAPASRFWRRFAAPPDDRRNAWRACPQSPPPAAGAATRRAGWIDPCEPEAAQSRPWSPSCYAQDPSRHKMRSSLSERRSRPENRLSRQAPPPGCPRVSAPLPLREVRLRREDSG